MNDIRYIFDSTPRQADVRGRVWLASPQYFLICLIVVAVCVLSWLLSMTGVEVMYPVAVSLSGMSGLSILFLLYGYTSYGIVTPPVKLKDVKMHGYNMAFACTPEVLEILMLAQNGGAMEEATRSCMKRENVRNMCEWLGVDPDDAIEQVVVNVARQVSWEEYVQHIAQYASKQGLPYIDTVSVAGALLSHKRMHTALRRYGLQEQDVSFAIQRYRSLYDEAHEHASWWHESRMLGFRGVGLSWIAGYTPFVDNVARIPQGNIWDTGEEHTDQVDQTVAILARRAQSNVLLVGRPGVGRLGVVKQLYGRIAENAAHPELNNLRVVYIHIGEILAMGTSVSEQLYVVARALREMEEAGNVIAVLDGLGSVLSGHINISDILLPFFNSPYVRVVVVMSTDEYHEKIASNAEIEHVFDIVHVPELNEAQTLRLLARVSRVWEDQTGVYAPYQVLREIIQKTMHILPQIPYPEKAFDILEEVLVEVSGRGVKRLAIDDVHTVVSRKTGIDIGRIEEQESERLLNLEDIIHRRVVNQHAAVAAVSRAMIRSRAQVRDTKRPIGTFLFLGPTGVGKTETAKALAHAYFGSEQYMQRLDMSQFSNAGAVDQLIGTQYSPGQLTSMISDHPFVVLLLDEFEKASREVQQVFLPVFDEGYIADGQGIHYSFHHAIIIATSNAGAEVIRKHIEEEEGEVSEQFESYIKDYILSNQIFTPEIFNRFDGVVTFTPLSEDHIREIARIMLEGLNKRLDERHGITINITDSLIDYLTRIGYTPEFGARPMARAIQDTVEYAVARKIIEGSTSAGEAIELDLAEVAAQQV